MMYLFDDFIESIDERLSALELKVVDVNSNRIARNFKCTICQ